MKRRFRLKRVSDFKRVRRLGRSYADPLVVLISCPNDQEQTRIGISAGRSVGGAVQRNRAKRLLRAAIAPLLSQLHPGHDLVLLARRPILDVKSGQVRQALLKKLEQADLLIDDNHN